MSNEKMREEFGVWFKENLAQLVRCQAIQGAISFENARPLLELAWEASRAAIVVDLPPEAKGWSPDECAEADGFNDCLDRCSSAIEAAGLKVKP